MSLLQSTARNLMVLMVESTGHISGVPGLTLTITLSKNGGAFASISPTVTDRGDGWYSLALTTAHTDTLGDFALHVTGAGADPSDIREEVVVALTPTVGAIADAVWDELKAGHSIADSFGDYLDDEITSRAVPGDAMDLVADAVDSAALATSAVTEIRSIVSGTSDSGTTTTMVDAARTEADADYWKGAWILFTSGNISGQCRLITAFNAGTDTITFAPATTQSVATQTYEILPNGAIDVGLWATSAPNALVSGRVDASVGAIAAGAVTAAAVATGAIDADAIAADAVTKLRSLANGTSDSGTTTTMVDAARTEADADYWKGAWILFTSGNISGQVRRITAFDAGTDTITFTPATTQAVGTQTYEILPAGVIDLLIYNLLSSMDTVQSGHTIDLFNIQADTDNIQTRLPGALVSGRIDASVGAVANNVITAAAIATDAIDADALALDAVNEIRDAILAGTISELVQAQPPTTPTVAEAIALLYMAIRNNSESTASERRIKNNAGTVICKAPVADDGTTFSQGKLVSGP